MIDANGMDTIERIAREKMGIPGFATRELNAKESYNLDRRKIQAALEAAYEAGREAVRDADEKKTFFWPPSQD